MLNSARDSQHIIAFRTEAIGFPTFWDFGGGGGGFWVSGFRRVGSRDFRLRVLGFSA